MLKFIGGVLKTQIVHSKTDQLWQGNEVLLARPNNCTCPVALPERYMRCTGMLLNNQQSLFRPIQSTKKGEHLRDARMISCSSYSSSSSSSGSGSSSSSSIVT